MAAEHPRRESADAGPDAETFASADALHYDPVDIALSIALDAATSERTREHIRHARQARVAQLSEVDCSDADLVTDGGQSVDGVDRRSILIGALGVSLGIGITVAADHEEGGQSPPSSEVVSVEAAVYDEFADMCALDLIVDVAPSERIVIQNDIPGGTDRTVQNTGKRILRAVIPENSSVQVYAVNLDDNTSKRLKTYHISDECEISEDVGTDGGERSQSPVIEEVDS